jgi:hypothetical protein
VVGTESLAVRSHVLNRHRLHRLATLHRHLSRVSHVVVTALGCLLRLVPEFVIALRRLYIRLPRMLVDAASTVSLTAHDIA